MSMPQTQLAPVKQYIDICFEVEGFLLKSKIQWKERSQQPSAC